MRMRAKYVRICHASARGVAERWREQYGRDGWPNTVSGSSKETYEKLCGLGTNPTIEAVDAIISNKSWTHLSCDGCSEYVLAAIELGEYETHTFCFTCIREAMAIIEDADKAKGEA